MRVFGIDPGSECTGYGCVETDGRRHRLIICGGLKLPQGATFPERLRLIHEGLTALIGDSRPDLVAIENLFHSVNVRSALKLGHARGVAMLAAVQAGVQVVEYTPAEIKRAVVVRLLLGLDVAPSPHDAADALAVALCHVHSSGGVTQRIVDEGRRLPRSWRNWRPPTGSRPS